MLAHLRFHFAVHVFYGTSAATSCGLRRKGVPTIRWACGVRTRVFCTIVPRPPLSPCQGHGIQYIVS